jgi:hypothetical protein
MKFSCVTMGSRRDTAIILELHRQKSVPDNLYILHPLLHNYFAYQRIRSGDTFASTLPKYDFPCITIRSWRNDAEEYQFFFSTEASSAHSSHFGKPRFTTRCFPHRLPSTERGRMLFACQQSLPQRATQLLTRLNSRLPDLPTLRHPHGMTFAASYCKNLQR